jgi:hypothetical protein
MFKFAARHVRAMTLPLTMSAGVIAPAFAQSAPAPTPAPTPNLIPGLEKFSLTPSPGSTVTQPATPPPVVRTLPTPLPSPTPARPVTASQARASEAPLRPLPPRSVPLSPAERTPVSAPTSAPLPATTAAPLPEGAETGAATPAPVASVTAAPTPVVAAGEDGPSWPLLGGAGAIVLLIGGLGFWLVQRRERFEDDEAPAPENGKHAHFDLIADRPDTPPEPAPRARNVAPAAFAPPVALDIGTPPKRGAHAIFDLGAIAPEPATPPTAPEASRTAEDKASVEAEDPAPKPSPVSPPATVTAPVRARLDIELYAKRAGTNLLSAAVEYDIVISNTGEAIARAIQVDVRLLSAGTEQDGWIGTLFSSPIERPTTTPFDLPPRGSIELTGMAMLPKEMVSVMAVQDRQLFVPVLTINLLYDWDGGTGQTATSYVVGVDRGEGTKLAPFRLDGTPRMHEGVSTLPYTISVRR